MITPEAYSYTPVSVGTTIPATLEAFNAGFASIQNKQLAAAVILSGSLPRFYGGEVTAGTFPVLNVAAGKLLLGDGTVYSFPAGTLTATAPGAADVFSVYVADDFTIDIAETVPGTALMVLATATVNGGATAFTIAVGELTEELTFTVNGDPESIVQKNGSVIRRSWAYSYDAAGRPDSTLETIGTGTITYTYVYEEGTGVLLRIDRTASDIALLLANGTVPANGSELADGVI